MNHILITFFYFCLNLLMKQRTMKAKLSPRQQKLTLFGLSSLRRNKLQHHLENYYNRKTAPKEPSPLKNHKPLIVQSRSHYSKQLKYPVRLRDDPQWPQEKRFRNVLKLYLQNKLSVDYFELLDYCSLKQKKNIVNHQKKDQGGLLGAPKAVVFKPSNPENIAMSPLHSHPKLFSNFNERSFRQAPVQEFYPQSLEHEFQMPSQTMARHHTEPDSNLSILQDLGEGSRLDSPVVRKLTKQNAQSFTKKRAADVQQQPSADFFRRYRSLTTAIYGQLQHLDETRDRKNSKGSRYSHVTSNQLLSKRIMSTASAPQNDEPYKYSDAEVLAHFLKFSGLQKQSEITKEQFCSIVKKKYGRDISGAPLITKLGSEEINLKLTVSTLSKMSLQRAHRMCFRHYDSNENSLIEESDLFVMMERSATDPFVEADYQKIGHYLAKHNSSVRQDHSKITVRDHNNRITIFSKMDSLLPPLDEATNVNSHPHNNQQSPKPKQKLFTLINEYKQEDSSIRSKTVNPAPKGREENWNIEIPFSKFREIFRREKPQLYYKVMYQMFGVKFPGITYPTTQKSQSSKRIEPAATEDKQQEEDDKVQQATQRIKSFRQACFRRTVQKIQLYQKVT